MESAAKNEGVFINIDLADLREGLAARDRIRNPESESNQASAKSARPMDRAPDFVQSYLGKGMLLDVTV